MNTMEYCATNVFQLKVKKILNTVLKWVEMHMLHLTIGATRLNREKSNYVEDNLEIKRIRHKFDQKRYLCLEW